MSSAMIQTMLGGGVAVEAAADSEKEGKREGENGGEESAGGVLMGDPMHSESGDLLSVRVRAKIWCGPRHLKMA